MLGFMTFHLAVFILDYAGVTHEYPHLLGIFMPLPVLHGLIHYLYTLQVTTNRFPQKRAVFIHLIPFFLLIALAIPFYLLSAREKLYVFANQGEGYEWYGSVQSAIFVFFGFGYSIASVLEVRRHRRNMDQFRIISSP